MLKNKKIRKIGALFIILALLLPLVPITLVSALSGTFYYTPAESNIAYRFWVSADASSNAEEAANAIDGNADTAWVAEPGAGQWFAIDLGGVYDEVRLTEIVFIDPTSVYRYILEGSGDGADWAILSDRSDNSEMGGGFADVFRYPGLRYLKVTFLTDYAIGIQDFKIFNYWRFDLDNGADVSGNRTGTAGYNINNTPISPEMPLLNGETRSIRGGAMNAASVDNGNNFYGMVLDMGWNTSRLRVWNHPRTEQVSWNPPQSWGLADGMIANYPSSPAVSAVGTTGSPNNVLDTARYVVGSGQQLAIDFHYSDFWADPQRQCKPYPWVNLPWDDPNPEDYTDERGYRIPNMGIAAGAPPNVPNPDSELGWHYITRGLVSEVKYFTYDFIEQLILQGTAPGIIAIGNEISHGMMWGKEYLLTNGFAPDGTTLNDHFDYFYRFMVDRPASTFSLPQTSGTTGDNSFANRLARSNIVIREDMPYGGGVEWVNYDRAKDENGVIDKESEEYQSFLTSVWRLSVLINAGQEAIQELNEKYDLDMKTEIHFASNVFGAPRGGTKFALSAANNSPEEIMKGAKIQQEKFITLVDEIQKNLVEMSGMVDRIGISYYPDWHGSYDYLQENMVLLQEVVGPDVHFNIAEVHNVMATGAMTNWMSDVNIIRSPWNNDGWDVPEWFSNPNVVPNGTTGLWNTSLNRLPTSFSRNWMWQGQDVMNIVTLTNDVPNNAGQGVWPWNAHTSGRGYWSNAAGTSLANAAGGQPNASFLSWSQGYALNALEKGIYITTIAGEDLVLPETVKSVDAKTGEITEFAVTWPEINADLLAEPGTFTVSNLERSGPYVDGVLRANFAMAGTMRDVTVFVTVVDPLPADHICQIIGHDYVDGICSRCGKEAHIVGAANARYMSIVETSKNSRVWVLTFNVDVTYSDGRVFNQVYSINLNGNNANQDGRFVFDEDHDLAGYTLRYDIKGNGSNIKAFVIG